MIGYLYRPGVFIKSELSIHIDEGSSLTSVPLRTIEEEKTTKLSVLK